MAELLLGALLTLVDFDLYVGSARIGVLPDVVGWILVVRGLYRLSEEETAVAGMLKRPIRIAKGLIAVTGILYLTDLLGFDCRQVVGWTRVWTVSGIRTLLMSVSADLANWAYLLLIAVNIGVMFVGYEVWWVFSEAILRLEMERGRDMSGRAIQNALKGVIAVQIISMVITTLLPNETAVMLGTLVGWLAVLLFIALLGRLEGFRFGGRQFT